MTRSCRHACLSILALAIMAGLLPTAALAFKEFSDEFKAVYVKEGTPLAAAVDTAKCNVCHMGKEKKNRNAYGQALDERLSKGDKKDAEKIRKALEEVAALPSAMAGKTFGDLIKDGKLPCE